MTPPKISAVILAAGLSSRMKAFKPLLPVGRQSMVETVIALFRACRIDDIVVVIGHNRNKIEPVIKNSWARPVFNPDYKNGMLTSIQTGVRHIHPESERFFLLPVDIPAIRPRTVKQLIQAADQAQTQIIMPYFNGQSGHPPLISCSLKERILALKPDQSLRDLILSCAEITKPVKVHDRGTLMDADNPDAYEKVCFKLQNSHVPDKEECLSIINSHLSPDDSIRQHLADVCMTAVKLAHATEANLDSHLIIAASLLHDVRRKEKEHAQKGARLLYRLGFHSVADIVGQHMDIDLDPCSGLQEKEIVYFADKICNGSGPDLNYHKRFAKALKKCPWAMTSISKRYENTKTIHTRIEASAGKTIDRILRA